MSRKYIYIIYPILILFSSIEAKWIEYKHGWADLNILYASKDILICHKFVSGDDACELFALEPNSQKVLWRQVSSSNTVSPIEATEKDRFICREGDFLVSRNFKTGQKLWSIKVPDIEQGSYARPKIPISPFMEQGEKSYSYIGPFSCPLGIVIFRSAGNDYHPSLFYQDWIILSSENGSLSKKGEGRFVGATENGCFLAKDNGENLIIFDWDSPGDVSSFIHSIKKAPSNFYQPYFSYSNDQIISYSCGNLCLISRDDINLYKKQISQKMQDFIYSSSDYVSVFNAEDRVITDIEPTNRLVYFYDWAILKSCILRYSLSNRIPESEAMPHWVELYDLRGNLVAHKQLSHIDTHRSSFQFIGTTTEGNPIMYCGEQLYVFDLPSLDMRWNYDLKGLPYKREGTTRSFFSKRNSDIIYEVEGNTFIEEPLKQPVPCEIYVNLIDFHTKQVLWSYAEKILIKDKKNGK